MGATSALKNDSVRNRVSEDEWQTRVNLAAAYRLAAHHGWTHMIYNHISARVPGRDEHFLINPLGFFYREITASCLVKVDLDGTIVDETPYSIIQAGFVIHSAVHRARPDVKCVMHTHTTAGIAVGAQKQGLLPHSMGACLFYNRIGYHAYEGPSLDLAERERLAQNLGLHNALVLRNHGLLTCGPNIGAAFHHMYQLEMACQSQIAAMAGGTELHLPPPEVCEHSARLTARPDKNPERLIWPAYIRLCDDLYPDYKT